MPPARIVFWSATVAGIGLTLRSVLAEPPPLPLALAGAALYLALLVCGVLLLRLRMFADAVIHGPRDATGVVLTFDDGIHPVHTPELLDALDAHGAKATFFVSGQKAEMYRDVIEEIVRRGHELGIRGFLHDRMLSLRSSRGVKADLERAIRVLENITDRTPSLFRPPLGLTNPTIARIADQLDLTVVGWSRDLEDGAIVAIDEQGQLAKVLERVTAKNLRIVPLSSWLEKEA